MHTSINSCQHPNLSFLTQLRLFFLYALIFTLPFEDWSFLHLIPNTSINKILGLLYFSLALLNANKLFSINKQSISFLYLIALWIVFLTTSLINHFSFGHTLQLSVNFLTLFIFYWLICNEIYIRPKSRNGIFLSFILSIALVYILIALGIGTQSPEGSTDITALNHTRIWFFGLNPNRLGNYGALAFLLTIFILNSRDSYIKFNKKLLLILIPGFIYTIGSSGSAGAVIALSVSLLVYFTFKKENLVKITKYYLYGIFIFIISFFSLNKFSYLFSKLQSFVYSGETTGRTKIWLESFNLIKESPIWGFGVSGAQSQLMQSEAGHYTAHNVFIDVALWSGIIGFIIYILFFLLILRLAWRYRSKTSDASSIALLAFLVILLLKS